MYGKERCSSCSTAIPDYQRNITDFLYSIQPRPKASPSPMRTHPTGGPFQGGQAVPDRERVRAGDLRALQIRLSGPLVAPHQDQGRQTDVFYWIGYAGDSILLTKQPKSWDLPPDDAGHGGRGIPEFGTPSRRTPSTSAASKCGPPPPNLPLPPVSAVFPKTEDWWRNTPSATTGTQLLVDHFPMCP